MSGQPYNTPLDAAKFRQQYLANLALRADLDDANLQANKVYRRTGAPTQPTDTRTTAEKQADLYRLRIDVRSMLSDIADGPNADKIVQQLDPYQLRFLSDQLPFIIADLKPKYRTGILAEIFMPYFTKYMDNYQRTKGVNAALQQEAGERILLNQDIILSNMANKKDVEDIGGAVRELGISNTGLGRSILSNVETLSQVVEFIPEVIRSMNEADNAIIKGQIQTTLNDLVKDLPTKTDMNELLRQLAEAQAQGNTEGMEFVLSKLADIIDGGADIRGEIMVLQQLVAQAKAERPTAPVGVATSQSIETFRFTDRAGREFSYINPAELTATGRPTRDQLLDYIDVVGGFIPNFFIGTTPSGVKKGSKMTLKAFLEAKDGIVRDALKRLMDEQQIQQAEVIRASPIAPMTPYMTPTRTPREELEARDEMFAEDMKGRGIKSVRMGMKGAMKGVKMGRGLVRPATMPNKRNDVLVPGFDIDYSQGVKPTPRFIPFGRFVINKNRLEKDIIAVKRPAGSTLADLPSKRVSRNLGKVVRTIAGGSVPSFDDINKLDKEEQEYLYLLASKSDLLDKVNLPTPKKDEDEADINQFEIMRGQIIAGNDSVELVKKFKQLILRMSERDLIPKRQVKELMITLAENGY